MKKKVNCCIIIIFASVNLSLPAMYRMNQCVTYLYNQARFTARGKLEKCNGREVSGGGNGGGGNVCIGDSRGEEA